MNLCVTSVIKIFMPNFNFIPFPNLSTHRLILRQVKITDDQEEFYLRSDEYINRYIGTRKKPMHIEEIHQHINKVNLDITKEKLIYWAIAMKGNPTLIGTICLSNFRSA